MPLVFVCTNERINKHIKTIKEFFKHSLNSPVYFTRSIGSISANERYKSPITDHVCQNNHIMDWEASEMVEQESDKFKRWVKESIHIRLNSPTMNRDEGAYQLSPI